MEQQRVKYIPHPKDKYDTSIWHYFLKAVDGTTAKCKQCNSVLKTLGGSTKGLHIHLASKHNKKVNQDNIINLPGPSNINNSESELPMKRKISHYFLPSETSSLDSFGSNDCFRWITI